MDQSNMNLLRKECSNGNDRACHTLQRLCEDRFDTACSQL